MLRASTKATDAASSFEINRAMKAGMGFSSAPAATMRPMLAGKHSRTVQKLMAARSREARRGPRCAACAVRVERMEWRGGKDLRSG